MFNKKNTERKRKRHKLNSKQFPNILSPSATCWSCWIHVKATCSSGGCFPKIVEWSFVQQGRTVWKKIPGKKRKPFLNRFTNKLRITGAIKKNLERGGSLCCSLSPSHLPPRAFIFLSPQPPHDTKGLLQRRSKGVEKTLKMKKLDLWSGVK